MEKGNTRLERHVELTGRGRRAVEELVKKLDLGVKENRIRVCRECIKDAVQKNEEAKQSPAPLNWNAEWWLCCRLREGNQCPLDLPSLNPILCVGCSHDTVY